MSLALAALGIGIVASGCYQPSVDACLYRCNSGGGGACPSGLTCNTDSWCVAASDDRCDAVGDGGIDTPDAPSPCGWDGVSNIDPCVLGLQGVTNPWVIPVSGYVEVQTSDPPVIDYFTGAPTLPTGAVFKVVEQVTGAHPRAVLLAVGDLTMAGKILASGPLPLILVSNGAAAISGTISLDPTSTGGASCNGTSALPGTPTSGGGGGGGFGERGASGGGTPSAGGAPGNMIALLDLKPLRGGCSGGDGGTAGTTALTGGIGGRGGNAIQIVGRTKVELTGLGSIQANGNFGGPGKVTSGGGGGGSGGGILIESPTISLTGGGVTLCANGGGGGANDLFNRVGSDCAQLKGGSGTGLISGGDGSFKSLPPTAGGTGNMSKGAGGGGGGAGRIRLHGQTVDEGTGNISPAATH